MDKKKCGTRKSALRHFTITIRTFNIKVVRVGEINIL